MHEMATIEERVLRVLYEAPATASDCARELQRYAADDGDVAAVLDALTRTNAVAPVAAAGSVGYRLTPIGSERLAQLVETRESRSVAS